MSKPAALSRSDLAMTLLLRLFFIAVILEVSVFVIFPKYSLSLTYGVVVFLLSNLIFSLYAFRYQGSQSSLLIIQAFGRGVFVKILFFALGLILIYRFDEQSLEHTQTAIILAAYFFMQACQIVLAIFLAKQLSKNEQNKDKLITQRQD
jgi:F0F1-type ATP synthase assembly protein I